MSERSAFRASILAADDMQRLLKRLTLVERFHAVMVTCEMPRVANELVDILRTEVSERRGVEMLVVLLDPYAKRENALEPMSERWLLDEVLEKLVFPPPEHQGASVLTIVDASNAMPADDDAWSLLFQRMNERRNAIMQAIAGPFLVVGPTRYVALVGRSAPDVWSIVGAIVDVPTPAMDDEWQEVTRDESGLDVTTLLEVLSLAFIHEPEDLDIATAKLEVANARRLFEQVPNLGLFRVSLAMQLTQMASLLLSQPDSQAIELLDESLELLQPYVDFERPPLIFGLFAYVHIFRGMARWVRKEFPQAVEDLEEGKRWLERDPQPEKDTIEAITLGATVSGTLGMLHRRLGHLDRAVEYFLECIPHYLHLLHSAPNPTGIEEQIAFVHDELGRIFCAKHDWDQAWAYFDQAARLHHQLWQRSPGDADALSSFASTRFAMIKLQGLRGDEMRARALANEALHAIEQYPNVSQGAPHLVELAVKIRAYADRWQ